MPALFDTAQLHRQRLRAARSQDTCRFLIDAAWAQLIDRLSDIKRSFDDILVLGPLPPGPLPASKITRPPVHLPALPDAGILPIETQSFDLVLSVSFLHTANDLAGLLFQLRHALRPGGAFLGAFPGGQTLHELRAALLAAETELTGGAAPRVHPFLQLPQAAALMQSAGFALPVVDSEKITVDYPALTPLLHDLRHMGEGNALTARPRTAPPRDLFTAAEEIYRAQHEAKTRLPATFDIVHLIGWAGE